jgi:uncharacterized protein YcbX
MKNQFIVCEIIIYPIKGLKGISMSSSRITEQGLANDRLYMLADDQGELISQRTHSQLALMKVKRVSKGWEITYKDESIYVQDGAMSDFTMNINMWEVFINCHEVSQTISAWFTKQLDIPCKLMVMPNQKTRLKIFNKAPYKTHLSFADGYPITTLGTKSMELLNQKLKQPIKANRFRPNIMIETNEAHEEDNWEDFMIGEQVKLRNIKPCVRCQVVTVDQETGISGKEPLTTLATYRMVDYGICFSSNAISLENGEIKLGDIITVLS